MGKDEFPRANDTSPGSPDIDSNRGIDHRTTVRWFRSLLNACVWLECVFRLVQAGDAFASGKVVSGDVVSFIGDTSGATLESGETVSRAQLPVGGTLWFHWNAPANGTVHLGAVGSGLAHVVTILVEPFSCISF